MEPNLFSDNPLEDDDFLDGMHDEEQEELGSDFHVHTELTDTPETPVPVAPRLNKRLARIKPMPVRLRKKGISTMLITKTDGRQILFVNPTP
jgi:hypothetical protein